MTPKKEQRANPCRDDAPLYPKDKIMSQQNNTPKEVSHQYLCSFCWRELPNGGWRVAGFGVCPPHLRLAETIINALRKHHTDYCGLGGIK